MAEQKKNTNLETSEKSIKRLQIERTVTAVVLILIILAAVAGLVLKSIVGVWWVEIQEDSTTRGAYIQFRSDKTYETFMYGVDQWNEKGTYKIRGSSLSGYIIFTPERGNEYVRKYNIRGTRLKIFNVDDTFISFLRYATN